MYFRCLFKGPRALNGPSVVMTVTNAASAAGGQTPTQSVWPPVFALGFRPFYLGGAAAAFLLLPLWLAVYQGGLDLPMSISGADPLAWHAHEMLFGFTAAIIVGFLYTAVRNWTGHDTPHGGALAALLLVWLAGRIAPFIAAAPVVAVIDLAFLPLAAAGLVPPILRLQPRGGQRRPWMPVIVLGLLGLASLLDHIGDPQLARALAFGTVMMLIAVIGGRIIPSFTMTGAQVMVPVAPTRDRIALIVLGLAVLCDIAEQVIALPAALLVLVNGIAAVVHLARLQQWRSHKALRVPLLAILHVGYAWLPIALALRALAALDLVAPALAVHALTVGAMAGLMLGMMTRSSLGHTGRALKAGPVEIGIYVAITLAALARLCAGLHADFQWPLLCAAGLLWEVAFGLFLLRYVPILLRPRADGKPG